MGISDGYIYIDSPDDIDIALELAIEHAVSNSKGYYSYWGGIIMPLNEAQQFKDYVFIRNLKTREMESHEVTINQAFCGLVIETKNGQVTSIMCHALNENEGYYSDNPDPLWHGTFHPTTKDIEIAKIALKRFFSSDNFEYSGISDPLTHSVIPQTIPDKK